MNEIKDFKEIENEILEIVRKKFDKGGQYKILIVLIEKDTGVISSISLDDIMPEIDLLALKEEK